MTESLTITLAFDPDLLDNRAMHGGIAEMFAASARQALRKRVDTCEHGAANCRCAEGDAGH